MKAFPNILFALEISTGNYRWAAFFLCK